MGEIAKTKKRENELKWGKKCWRAGWIGFPQILVTHQRRLGLDSIDLNIILHLLKHWWNHDRFPYPSKKSIAEAMGIHPSTVQRRIRAMEEVGLISRIPRKTHYGGQQSNEYDLTGLVKRAQQLSEEEQDGKKEDKARKDARKKPSINRKFK